MIELVSVEVTNFRSFSRAVFTPLGVGQGLTAINGLNGMGKSSIVHAIGWALYGITPDGVRVGALRRQGSEGDVEVKVVIRHDGQTIEVVRGLRGRNDTTIAAITVDGVEQTNVSAKTATNWIINRFGLDSEAFLTAFVVRQKELDSLVRARPAERRKTIERLAGIERMSAALDLARQEARQAQRLLDSLPETTDPAVAEEAVASAQHLVAHTGQSLETASKEAERTALASQNADTEVTEARAALEAVTAAKYARDLADQKIDGLTVEVSRLEKASAGAGDLDQAKAEAAKASAALAEAKQKIATVSSLVARASTDEARAASAHKALTSAKTTHDSSVNTLTALQDELGRIPDDLDSQVADAASKVSALADERGAARGEWDRLKKAVETLKEATAAHAAQCPTCAHPLGNGEELIASLTESLTAVQERGRKISEELKAAEDLSQSLAEQATARTSLTAQIKAAQSAKASAEESLALAEKAAEEAAATAAESRTQATAASAAASAAQEALDALEAADRAAQTALRQAEGAAEAAVELEAARKRFADAEESLTTAETALEAARKRAGAINIDQLEQTARQAQIEAQAAAEKASAARTSHALAQRDLETAEADLARALAAAESRKAALAEVERTTAVASSLEEFRRDRLARLTPELSEVASDFVARMTDGKYTSVMLDEDFTPVLTDASGAERPVAWLSGGEESAVALALRVAIGEVLAGQRGGLLVLDEVLTAQDQTRRQATMAAIRALPRQIITINHVSEATDMVDLVAEVVSDGEGASTIVEIAPEGPVGADVSDALIDAV